MDVAFFDSRNGGVANFRLRLGDYARSSMDLVLDLFYWNVDFLRDNPANSLV
jgi:hypothetical protein